MDHSELDIHFSRIIDARAGAADWDAVERHAAADPGVWKALAMTQRDATLLSGSVRAEVIRAESVTLPALTEPAGDLSFAKAQVSLRARRVATWAGWAAAAALGVAFINKPAATSPGIGQTAGVGSGIQNAADALSLYLEKGQADGSVIGEQPNMKLVDVNRLPEGKGFEVIYIRQIVERARVVDLYRFSSDESGQPAPVPVQPVRARAKPAV